MGFEPTLTSWKDDILPLDEKDIFLAKVLMGFEPIFISLQLTVLNHYTIKPNLKPIIVKGTAGFEPAIPMVCLFSRQML